MNDITYRAMFEESLQVVRESTAVMNRNTEIYRDAVKTMQRLRQENERLKKQNQEYYQLILRYTERNQRQAKIIMNCESIASCLYKICKCYCSVERRIRRSKKRYLLRTDEWQTIVALANEELEGEY